MHPLLLLSFLMYVSSSAFCQNTDWQTWTTFLQQPNQSLWNFELFQAKYRSQNNSTNAPISSAYLYKRTIFKEHLQTVYRISRFGQKGHHHYTLNIISKDDNIIHLELQANDKDSSELSVSSKAYQVLIESFGKHATIRPDLLHKYFNPARIIFVGFTCNPFSDVKNESDELRALVEAKNKNEILKWCCSLSPEIRCYGAIGLYQLKKRGLELTDEERSLLKKIRTEFTTIYTCYRCDGEGQHGTLGSIRSAYSQAKRYFDLESPLPRA